MKIFWQLYNCSNQATAKYITLKTIDAMFQSSYAFHFIQVLHSLVPNIVTFVRFQLVFDTDILQTLQGIIFWSVCTFDEGTDWNRSALG